MARTVPRVGIGMPDRAVLTARAAEPEPVASSTTRTRNGPGEVAFGFGFKSKSAGGIGTGFQHDLDFFVLRPQTRKCTRPSETISAPTICRRVTMPFIPVIRFARPAIRPRGATGPDFARACSRFMSLASSVP